MLKLSDLNTETKIRWLLVLITVGLFATILTFRWSITDQENLTEAAASIQENLNQKEEYVFNFLNVNTHVKDIKNLENDEEKSLFYLNLFEKQNIFFQTYKSDKLVFWSSNKLIPRNITSLKEGTSLLKYNNGWYQVIKFSDNDFIALFFIPVKYRYQYQNQYLDNNFSADLTKDKSIDIAGFEDNSNINVNSIEGRYLFSIIRKPSATERTFTTFEILLWILSYLMIGLCVYNWCKWLGDRGYPLLATGILFGSFILARYLNLNYHEPQALYSLDLFNPRLYASNSFFPSLGDFYLNIFFFLWILIFLNSYKKQVLKPVFYKLLIGFWVLFIVAVVSFSAYLLDRLFFGLIYNSSINFEVTNILNLNLYSVLGLFILCISLLCFYIICDFLANLSYQLQIPLNQKLLIFGIAFLGVMGYNFSTGNFSIFFVCIFGFLFALGYIIYRENGKIKFSFLMLVALIFATVVSIKLTRYENLKESETRKRLALKLESAEDPNAVVLFYEIEKQIAVDAEVKNYLLNADSTSSFLINHFQKKYVNGYLAKFDYDVYVYDAAGEAVKPENKIKLKAFKDLVVAGTLKVSNNFYRINNAFGLQEYFAIIPIIEKEDIIGTLVLDLRSKSISRTGSFPQLLTDSKLKTSNDFQGYSYAFYNDGTLLNQSGNYVYSLVNYDFVGKYKDFNTLRKDRYNHLIYQPSLEKLIIISRETNTFLREIAAISFFFIIFLVFILIVVSSRWAWHTLTGYDYSFRNFRWKFLLSSNRMLYKTRIQIALVLAVVVSLVVIGVITFSYISFQYQDQQKELIRSRLRLIADAYEQINYLNKERSTPPDEFTFDDFAKDYSADLNLYNTNGDLIYSTQPKIFNMGLTAPKMNPEAFIYISRLQKSEHLQEENIDKLVYMSAYEPIRDSKNQVIAYMQLPYFANSEEYNQKIGAFLNLLINIYALVLVSIGLFAIVVANQITNPLTLIEKSLSKTKIGQKNESIPWKRNDEIGNLIKEYNNMIAALEASAEKLAKSERETAWREMAKQVAHEIKNPLTPLKLSMQLIERSWKEKDINFGQKFQKFSHSFLEQIDSLARIASEFSNFAKMPEVKFEKVDLPDVIDQAIQVFKNTENLRITYQQQTFQNALIMSDKDQILRSFNNLLKNAIEAIPENRQGELLITAIYETEKQIKIIIKDNGNGIPDNLREKIFVPNFTTKSSGTGLGLAFVKQAIENSGGSISFHTQNGVGTTFYIVLPVVS